MSIVGLMWDSEVAFWYTPLQGVEGYGHEGTGVKYNIDYSITLTEQKAEE